MKWLPAKKDDRPAFPGRVTDVPDPMKIGRCFVVGNQIHRLTVELGDGFWATDCIRQPSTLEEIAGGGCISGWRFGGGKLHESLLSELEEFHDSDLFDRAWRALR